MTTNNKKAFKGAGASKDASNPLNFASLQKPDGQQSTGFNTDQLLGELEGFGVTLFDLTIPQQIDKAKDKLLGARADYQKVKLAVSELVKRNSDEKESEEEPAYASVKTRIMQKKKDLQREIHLIEKTIEELVVLLPPVKEQQTSTPNTTNFDASKVDKYPRIYNGKIPPLDGINWIIGSYILHRYAQEHRLSEEAVIAIAKSQFQIVGPNVNADRTIVQFCIHIWSYDLEL